MFGLLQQMLVRLYRRITQPSEILTVGIRLAGPDGKSRRLQLLAGASTAARMSLGVSHTADQDATT